VLLYELLTGKTPFEAKRLLEAGLDEVRRIIREEEPVRPSARLHTLDAAEQTTVAKLRQSDPPKLVHLIQGDLDWIVMKALEKDRTRRYETPRDLAADIDRHLKSQPIAARRPSVIYTTRKLLRRRGKQLALAALLAVAATWTVAVTWQHQQTRPRTPCGDQLDQDATGGVGMDQPSDRGRSVEPDGAGKSTSMHRAAGRADPIG